MIEGWMDAEAQEQRQIAFEKTMSGNSGLGLEDAETEEQYDDDDSEDARQMF